MESFRQPRFLFTLGRAIAQAPCWAANPVDRPGFSELRTRLLGLGAVQGNEDTPAPRRVSADLTRAAAQNDAARSLRSTSATGNDDLLLRGPSVHHIEKILLPLVLVAVRSPWKDKRGSAVSPPESATIAQAVEAVVKPAGATVQCPHTRELGAAYVDTLAHRDNVGRATALLSYTWGYRLASVAHALSRWSKKSNRDPKRTYMWVCSLCLNQHRIFKATVSPTDLADEFGARVRAIGYILPMLEPWRNPVYLSRAWCLFELYTAITESKSVTIEMIMTDSSDQSFLKAMADEGYSCINAALESVRSEDATASVPADLKAIRELVQSTPGGFNTLNMTVKAHLHRWFEAHGAIKSARRIPSRQSSSSSRASGGSVGSGNRPWSREGQRQQHSNSSMGSVTEDGLVGPEGDDLEDGYLDIAEHPDRVESQFGFGD